jgi:hypothetical protein
VPPPCPRPLLVVRSCFAPPTPELKLGWADSPRELSQAAAHPVRQSTVEKYETTAQQYTTKITTTPPPTIAPRTTYYLVTIYHQIVSPILIKTTSFSDILRFSENDSRTRPRHASTLMMFLFIIVPCPAADCVRPFLLRFFVEELAFYVTCVDVHVLVDVHDRKQTV